MSIQAMSWVIEKSESVLASRLALLAIANHAKADGSGAWPSISTIAKEARISEAQTHRCIKTLQRLGELVVEKGAGPRGCNLYDMPKVRQPRLHETPVKLRPLSFTQQGYLKGVSSDTDTPLQDETRTVLREPSIREENTHKEAVCASKSGFQEFWNLYPRKNGGTEAVYQWNRITVEEQKLAVAGVELWKRAEQWNLADGRYVPYASTFLKEKRYLEEPWVNAFAERKIR